MFFSGLKKLFGLFQLFIHKYTESKNNESKKVHRKNKPKMYQTQSLKPLVGTTQSEAATTRHH